MRSYPYLVSETGLRRRFPLETLPALSRPAWKKSLISSKMRFGKAAITRSLPEELSSQAAVPSFSVFSQLFEFQTGLDTRIGYPNEHLGKTALEDVKSPMYATSVGLVLAGFKSLDDREESYNKRIANGGVQKIAPKREFNAKDIFRNISDRLKSIIHDEIGDDSNY